MALDARHRTSIYGKLVPLLGDDDTNALMTEFPSVEADELVTKDFLRAELALTRSELRAEMADLSSELRGEMAELRDELRGEMADLRGELHGGMAELRGEMAELQNRLTVRMSGMFAASTAILGMLISLG